MFKVSLFKSRYSTQADDEAEMSWPDMLDWFLKHEVTDDKNDAKLFNGTVFVSDEEGKRGRTKSNVEKVTFLVLDYDGTLTLEEAKVKFQKYTYLGYTSHSHQRVKGVEKFRLIFPLRSPIPAHWKTDEYNIVQEKGDYYNLTEAIQKFAPGCDPVVLKPTQLYYLPSCPHDLKEHAQTWNNEGTTLDWTKWDTDAYLSTQPLPSWIPRKANGLPNRQLDPDVTFKVGSKNVAISDIHERVHGVTCPFHADKKGSEFIVRYASGTICFHCKHCGTFSLHEDQIPALDDGSTSAPDSGSAIDALVFDPTYWDHTDRSKIRDVLQKAKAEILADHGKDKAGVFQGFASHILYLPEGSGKSQLALEFAMDEFQQLIPYRSSYFRPQVVFACKSWNQVFEQHASFSKKLQENGRHCRIAAGFDAAVRLRFQTNLMRKASIGYDVGNVKTDESVQAIMLKNPAVTEDYIRLTLTMLSEATYFKDIAMPAKAEKVLVLNENESDIDADFSMIGIEEQRYKFVGDYEHAPSMIFTTFAQLRLLKARRDRIPLNWIIWIDDPDIDELIDIKPTNGEKYEESEKIKKINKTSYAKRPVDQILGMGFPHHRVIYTTTEKLTVDAIRRKLASQNIECITHGDRFKVTGGKITILGSKAVRKDSDAIFPLFTARRDLVLIADGIPAQYNHSNNKGVNSLRDKNLLIEVSVPHPASAKTFCDAFGLNYKKESRDITRTFMLDRMHQAIGRNSGYRTSSSECVVVVDHIHHKYLLENCGYAYDKASSVVIDRTKKMTRKDTRLPAEASSLTSQVENFINNFMDYAEDLRVIKADINKVMGRFSDETKKSDYVLRLLIAITTYSTVRADMTLCSKPSSQEKKFKKLMDWIISTHVPPSEHQNILDEYRKAFR